VFYYDCIDNEKKNGESQTDFDARVAAQEEYLDAIDALEGFHVRRGHLASGRNKQQKEVDVLLAVDMMNHAFSRNMTKALLISGDRDFRPVVQSVAAIGTYVQVMYRKETGAKPLGNAADFVEHLDVTKLIEWTAITPGDNRWAYFPTSQNQNFHSVANRDNHKEPSHVEICTGYLASSRTANRKIRKYKNQDNGLFVIHLDKGPLTLAMHAFTDDAVLENFITLQYGPITWTP
jgi:hypothetical protein